MCGKMLLKITLVILFYIIKDSICQDNEQQTTSDSTIQTENMNFEPRIVGGTLATLGQFKSTVSIQTYYHFCGGTLINSNHVLTAAHCVVQGGGTIISPSLLNIVAGDLKASGTAGPYRQKRDVSHIFVHAKYNPNTLENDIAIIRLNKAFAENDYVKSINRTTTRPADGTNCQVSGWGNTEQGGAASPNLLYTNISVISDAICARSYREFRTGMICIGDMNGGKDACQGDSGGGVLCNNEIVGIVSFGYGCAQPDYPGVNTLVSSYSTWINSALSYQDNTTQQSFTTTSPNSPGSASFIYVSINLLILMFIFIYL